MIDNGILKKFKKKKTNCVTTTYLKPSYKPTSSSKRLLVTNTHLKMDLNTQNCTCHHWKLYVYSMCTSDRKITSGDTDSTQKMLLNNKIACISRFLAKKKCVSLSKISLIQTQMDITTQIPLKLSDKEEGSSVPLNHDRRN